MIDFEIKKILNDMPNWNPAIKNGKPTGSIRQIKVIVKKI